MNKVPLLIISDSPSATSGLGRICRDLSIRIYEHLSDIFTIASFGYGSVGSCKLPFQQYYMPKIDNWVLPDLPDVWRDFAGSEQGVIFSVWDASRLLWFAKPETYCEDGRLRAWFKTQNFLRWGYFPIDATGPNNKLSVMLKECLLGYDRVLCYTDWARKIVERTLEPEDSLKRSLAFVPHGIDTNVFKRQDRYTSRKFFHEKLRFKGPEIGTNEILIGIVATNQARKDYGTAIHAIAELAKEVSVRLYIQIDALERFWSIPALLEDYGLMSKVIVNVNGIPDEMMSYIYTACDITLGIGLGEGFGYPIFESLACNTPVVTGSYGGQAEFLPDEMLIRPEMMRLEGLYNTLRPVYTWSSWKEAIIRVLKQVRSGRLRAVLPQQLAWDQLWQRWEAYFRESHRSLLPETELSPDQTSSKIETDKEKASRIQLVASEGYKK